MVSKKDQHKAGIPQKPRGQQMGVSGNPDKSREAKRETPALRGRRRRASEMFADKSSQHVASNPATPSSNAPSVPAAAPGGAGIGETGGERVFKRRQKAKGKR
jgi:hypothetical protein